jgi:RHS repeat-associated protein
MTPARPSALRFLRFLCFLWPFLGLVCIAATQTSTTYNVLGQRIAMTDQEGRLTRYRHDALGRLLEVRQYLDQYLAASDSGYSLPATHSSLLSTSYAYDELGRQTSQTDAQGRTTRYEYDALGRRTARTLPGNTRETYAYDDAGRLESHTDFNGETVEHLYDEHDRLIARVPSATARSRGALKATFTYTPNGQRQTQRLYDAADQSVWWENYTYDERDRLASKQTPIGTLTHLHDAQSNLTATATTAGSELHYAYDSENRLFEVEDRRAIPSTAEGRLTYYGYTPVGALDYLALPNGTTTNYTYNSAQRLQDLTTRALGLPIASFTYTLRAGGHRSTLTERIGSAQMNGTPRRTEWTYDALYRLTSETVAGGADPGQLGTVSYTYDKVGNRLNRTSTVATLPTTASTYNTRDQLATDTYDANGNTLVGLNVGMTAGQPSAPTDTYDDQNRLVLRTETGPGGRTLRILYDADGNRVKKSITTGANTTSTYYLVDTQNPTGYAQVIEEHTQLGTAPITLSKSYAYGLDLISMATLSSGSGTPPTGPPPIRYYGYDGLGSVRYLTNETGTLTDRYYYDAYGILLQHLGTSDNTYLYAGEQWDPDLGLYYNRARYLNPNSGRFWSQDSFEGLNSQPQSLHKYLYAHSDPVNGIDPSGHNTLTLPDLLGGLAGRGILEGGIRLPALVTVLRAARVVAGATAIALTLKRDSGPNIVYRRLSNFEAATPYRVIGLTAQNILSNTTPADHILGDNYSRFISTTHSLFVAKYKYNNALNPIVQIDLKKVPAYLDYTIPAVASTLDDPVAESLAVGDQEVLVIGHVPAAAIIGETR